MGEFNIKDGKPLLNGKYVCWVNNEYGLPNAKTIFLMWVEGRWFYPMSDCTYREYVYQFLGPLPALRLED